MNVKHPKFCHLCGQPLTGSYLIYNNGLAVCKQCDATAPRCSQCNIPSHEITSVRGVLICPTCRQKAAVCPCCRLPILGKYYIIGDSPVRYCETCVTTRPRCDICRVPLDNEGKTFAGKNGNIYRCAACFRSVVTTFPEAQRLYRDTAMLLKRELALDISPVPALQIVDRETLMALHHEASMLPDPSTPLGPEHQHLLGFFQRDGENRIISIERLLPEMLFRAVAAHELAHAWQSFHAPEQSPKIVEGFAEWVAYRILLALNQQRDAARMTRRTDLYGEGLQYFIALERQQGRSHVLQRATQS